jgi:hypothetical protein
MIIGNSGDRLLLERIESVPDHLPTPGDFRLRVAVESSNFSGCHSVWISLPNYQRFLNQLDELELHRKGSAELPSMSPGAFRLRISIVDRSGHLVLDGSLGQSDHLRSSVTIEHRLDFGFEFDPSDLVRIVREFHSLPGG